MQMKTNTKVHTDGNAKGNAQMLTIVTIITEIIECLFSVWNGLYGMVCLIQSKTFFSSSSSSLLVVRTMLVGDRCVYFSEHT